jgi:hypothetical protein
MANSTSSLFNDGKTILLRLFGKLQIIHHKLIKGKANPFDEAWDNYFINRARRTCTKGIFLFLPGG